MLVEEADKFLGRDLGNHEDPRLAQIAVSFDPGDGD